MLSEKILWKFSQAVATKMEYYYIDMAQSHMMLFYSLQSEGCVTHRQFTDGRAPSSSSFTFAYFFFKYLTENTLVKTESALSCEM